jgi:hypothetical protein
MTSKTMLRTTLTRRSVGLRPMAGMPLSAFADVLEQTSTCMVELHRVHFAPGSVRNHVRATAPGLGAGKDAEKVAALRPGA